MFSEDKIKEEMPFKSQRPRSGRNNKDFIVKSKILTP